MEPAWLWQGAQDKNPHSPAVHTSARALSAVAGDVVYTYDFSTQEAQAIGLQVRGQLRLHEILFPRFFKKTFMYQVP